jgi:hypothetical protein
MGRVTGKLTRSVLKRTEELRGHPPVDMEGALSASAHSEVVALAPDEVGPPVRIPFAPAASLSQQ